LYNKLKENKKQSLRNNEYYDMQETFDELYSKSKRGKKFTNLMEIISKDENIKLAYRNIKNNTGSKTSGTDGKRIRDLAKLDTDKYVKVVKQQLKNYHPQEVRRIFIPKPNGKLRPLGIPTIRDRIIQQAIKQVMEPILEAKFNERSYGFRPNRSSHHAIAYLYKMVNLSKLHYIVDIDIKGFFDNVNHAKLIKQLWTLGIRDKNLLKVINKMLKTPIEGEGIPTKGTPQGGILSPLLSNVVLNELDWWIDSQWVNIPTKYEYTKIYDGVPDKRNQYRALRKTNLKEIFIVRYADDFKILCKDRITAEKTFHAVKEWLYERLHLEISDEKSKITNLRKRKSEFLGFNIALQKKKGNKRVIKSSMTEKAKRNAIEKLRNKIKELQKVRNQQTVNRYNSAILGLQNYYRIATSVYIDFKDIAYIVGKSLKNRLKSCIKNKGDPSNTYNKLYGEYKCKKKYIGELILFPIHAIKHHNPMNFKRAINNYTAEGRILIHGNLRDIEWKVLRCMMINPVKYRSTEYNDNRISLFIGQKGKCRVTGNPLDHDNMECHHITPRKTVSDDSYKNLVLVEREVHKLIHATNPEIILKYTNKLNLTEKKLATVNKYRQKIGNNSIIIE